MLIEPYCWLRFCMNWSINLSHFTVVLCGGQAVWQQHILPILNLTGIRQVWHHPIDCPPPKKKISLEVLTFLMTACWILHSGVIYLWRNVNISSIFHYSKSASVNTQHSSLWDTIGLILLTNKEVWYWFSVKFSIELHTKR